MLTTTLRPAPPPDLSLLLRLSQRAELPPEAADSLCDHWRRWLPSLCARQIQADGESYLLLWLEEPVEQEIHAAWDDAPSHAFLLGCLATALVAAAATELLPGSTGARCLPLPRIGEELEFALQALGLKEAGKPILTRQFALLTPTPFRGGCGQCSLEPSCPGATERDPAGIQAPGLE